MRDFSLNLPSWAVREGYRLEGGSGTYDDLFLYRNGNLIRWWEWLQPIPNIFELEELVVKCKSQKDQSRCQISL